MSKLSGVLEVIAEIKVIEVEGARGARGVKDARGVKRVQGSVIMTWSLHGCQTCTSVATSVMPLALTSCILKSHGCQTCVVCMDVMKHDSL